MVIYNALKYRAKEEDYLIGEGELMHLANHASGTSLRHCIQLLTVSEIIRKQRVPLQTSISLNNIKRAAELFHHARNC